MTDSCREQVVSKVQTVLQAIEGLTIARNRQTAIEAKDLPMAILFEGDEEKTVIFTGEDNYYLPLQIQVAINKAGEAGAKANNNWRALITKALMADRTLGGLARDLDIDEPGEWIGVDVDAEDVEGFMFSLTVNYATAEGDPFTFFN